MKIMPKEEERSIINHRRTGRTWLMGAVGCCLAAVVCALCSSPVDKMSVELDGVSETVRSQVKAFSLGDYADEPEVTLFVFAGLGLCYDACCSSPSSLHVFERGRTECGHEPISNASI